MTNTGNSKIYLAVCNAALIWDLSLLLRSLIDHHTRKIPSPRKKKYWRMLRYLFFISTENKLMRPYDKNNPTSCLNVVLPRSKAGKILIDQLISILSINRTFPMLPATREMIFCLPFQLFISSRVFASAISR